MKKNIVGIITPVIAMIGTCAGITYGQSALPNPPAPPQSSKVIWQAPQISPNPLSQSQNQIPEQYKVAQNLMPSDEVRSADQLPSPPSADYDRPYISTVERVSVKKAESGEEAPELEKSLDDLYAELEKIKKELGKKSDKPDTSKSLGSPKIGGRIFIDSVSSMRQNADSVVPYGQGRNHVGVREARIALTGAGFDFIDYKLEVGLENYVTGLNDTIRGTVNFKDLFVGFKNIPLLGYVRIGNQYIEDGGSEVCNGSTNFTFMEIPSPAGDQFASRRLGISSRHLFANDRGRLFFGVYNARSITEEHKPMDDNQGVSFNTRLTYAPYFAQEGRCMFLLGGYYHYTDPQSNATYSHTVRPGSWGVGINTLSTGGFEYSNYHKAGFETVYQNGRFAVQTDMFLQSYGNATSTSFIDGDDKTAYGGFVMVRYLLTRGDYRKYNQDSASWGTMHVSCPFMVFERGNATCIQGPGAWEIAGVYGYMDTSDFKGTNASTIRYGNDNELGFALNWYWNSNLKWCLNYVHQFSNITYQGDRYDPTSDYLGLSCRIHF